MAAVVAFYARESGRYDARLFSGPLTGPLELTERRKHRWDFAPFDVAVDGDRLLVLEASATATRLRLFAPGAAPRTVRSGSITAPIALAGDRVAFESHDRVRHPPVSEGLSGPRFAGTSIAVLEVARFGADRPGVLDPGTSVARPIGLPSQSLQELDADARGVAWLANGCVLYAPVGATAPAEPRASCGGDCARTSACCCR